MSLTAAQKLFAPISLARAQKAAEQVKLKTRPDNIPLAFGLPFPESFPINSLVTAAQSALTQEGTQALQYFGGPSIPKLRDLIVDRLNSRGFGITKDEILVTTGSSQAIDLTNKLFLCAGDRMAVEAPTFFAALKDFQASGAEVKGIPVTDDGMDVQYLADWLKSERKAGRPGIKLLYVIANFQNPTGTTLSLESRHALLDLASTYDFIILEDDAYGELYFDEPAPPALKSLDKEGRVVYTGTFSKIVAPGVRLGWAVASPDIIAALSSLKTDGGTAQLSQAIVYHFCAANSLDDRVRWLRSEYKKRWEVMRSALIEYMPKGSHFTDATGGFFTWLTVPGINTSVMYPAAVENGVTYVEGSSFFADPRGHESMRLCFSFCDEQTLREGIRRLADTVKSYK